MMIALTETEILSIKNRHADVFRQKLLRRFAPLIGLTVIGLYFVYVWMFFSMTQVLERANWAIAGTYLADWVSYETRPDIEFRDGYLEIEFPKYDALGNDPKPVWIISETALVKKTIPVKPTAPASGTSDAGNGASFLGALSENPPQSSGGFMAGGFMGKGGAVGGTEQPLEKPQVTQSVSEQEIVTSQVIMGDARISIQPKQVEISFAGETVVFDIIPGESVRPRQALPEWVGQKRDGGKAIARFGFVGRVEVENDEVKVRHRFWGWENFLFDVNSPFWGQPLSQTFGQLFSSDQIEPGISNLALAWDNIKNNAEWQHGDVWIKLLQTIIMAFIGTLFASLLAFPFAFFAARNITPNRTLNWTIKRFFDFTRSVDMLIWALFFTRAFGPGPLAGISAIFVTDTGTFGKLYSEALENIDDNQREGVKSVGASQVLVQRYGVMPQVLPVFISQSLYFWESNTRSATIIGAVGAGGIGLKLWEAMRTNSDWENVAYMVVLILMVVFAFDNISNFLRSRLISGKPD